jgi:hypothetical protein
VVALGLAASPALANTITVTTTEDGVAVPGSLRKAVEEEVEPGGTVVVPPGTYALTIEQLEIKKGVTILGAGASSTIITAHEKSRVLKVNAAQGEAVTISGVTLTEGLVEEPALEAQGGGVIDFAASLTLEHSVVSHNVADTDGPSLEGGGISKGGGIYATGPLQLSDVVLSGNLSTARGGSEAGGGIAEGGGVWSTRGATLDRVTFTQNAANADGGSEGGGGITRGGAAMISEEGSAVALQSVSAAGNLATAAGGAGAGGGISRGGALFVELEGANASISGLTLSGNSALAPAGAGGGGGIAEGGGLRLLTEIPVTVTNATITGNLASSPGTKLGEAEGGGMWTSGASGDTTILNSTLDANTSAGDPTGGGGGNLEGEAKIRDTIISGGVGPATRQNCGDVVESLGNNLEDRDECGFHGPGDKVNVSPQLGALQANGGPLATQAPAQTSPAVDAGASCAATDARGIARPQGPACDIGAYELALPGVSTGGAPSVGTTFAGLLIAASNPDLLPGSAFVQVGTTTAYGLVSASVSLGAGASIGAGQVALAVKGLQPGTLYHYRAVATNPDGTVFGADRTFTTLTVGGARPRPVLSGLALHPSHLRAQPGNGASLAKRRGAALVYKDSQAATTRLTVLRSKRGYRVGHGCRASKPRHAKGHLRRCTLYVALGTFRHADKGGSVSLHFTGRVAGHRLAPGSYKLSAQARNSSGLNSNVLTISFSVVR